MFLAGVVVTLYVIIALFSASMTYCEQQQNPDTNRAYAALGYMACALWPVTLIAVACAARRTAPPQIAM